MPVVLVFSVEKGKMSSFGPSRGMVDESSRWFGVKIVGLSGRVGFSVSKDAYAVVVWCILPYRLGGHVGVQLA